MASVFFLNGRANSEGCTTKGEFTFSKNKGLAESLHYQRVYGGSYADLAKALINLDVIVKNAKLVEQHYDNYKGTKRQNDDLQSISILISGFKDGENIIPVKLDVKTYKKIDGRLYMTVALTNIKEANVLGESIVANQSNKSSNLLSASEINIAELVKRINPVEKDFLKYFPDEMLNEEQVKAKITAIDKNKEKIANIKPKSEESADTFVEVDSEVLKNVYNKYNDPSRWEAERVGDANKKPMSMTNIIAKVRHDFGLNITNGYVRAKNVNGFFDPKNLNGRANSEGCTTVKRKRRR